MQAVHRVGGQFPLLQLIKPISKQVRLNHSVYELYLNKLLCQLLRSIRSSALDKKTQVSPAFSCSSAAAQAANSHSSCKKHRRRRSAADKTELLAPASPPVMFLKNILIDAAIRRGKSQRRSPGTSAEEDFASPGKFISTLPSACHDVWLCAAARAHCREHNVFWNPTAARHREKGRD